MKRNVKHTVFKNEQGMKYEAGYIQNRNSTLRKRQEETRFARFSFKRKHLKINILKITGKSSVLMFKT